MEEKKIIPKIKTEQVRTKADVTECKSDTSEVSERRSTNDDNADN